MCALCFFQQLYDDSESISPSNIHAFFFEVVRDCLHTRWSRRNHKQDHQQHATTSPTIKKIRNRRKKRERNRRQQQQRKHYNEPCRVLCVLRMNTTHSYWIAEVFSCTSRLWRARYVHISLSLARPYSDKCEWCVSFHFCGCCCFDIVINRCVDTKTTTATSTRAPQELGITLKTNALHFKYNCSFVSAR